MVVWATSTAIQMEGSTTRYHLSHCAKAQPAPAQNESNQNGSELEDVDKQSVDNLSFDDSNLSDVPENQAKGRHAL